MNNNKKYLVVFGIFALVLVTTVASFAFFTYSRVGNTTTTIISGDIEFTYKEGKDASLANAFPVRDEVGANDTSEEYTFTVNLKSTSQSNKMNYNVYLLDNNKGTENFFTNDQIKFALIKDGTFVAGTSGNAGKKLTDISGFSEGATTGEGLVLENQEIVSGKTDEYKLRIWISDEVNYSNTDRVDDNTDEFNDAQISNGKYNGYKYSLKVKVTSDMASTLNIGDILVEDKNVTFELSDVNGLKAYSITSTSDMPSENEWIEITNDTSKSNVTKTASGLIKNKTIILTMDTYGKFYLHVKNNLNEVKTKDFNAYQKLSEKIIELSSTNTSELRVDKHNATGQQSFATTEYRYWSAGAKNYVVFNNETWRIVGVFDVDDGTGGTSKVGNVEKRVKLVRDDSIGSLSWDYSDTSVNEGLGVNEWNQADLMHLLNSGAYYNRTNGVCYSSKLIDSEECDFSTTGLTDESKEMIGAAKWYLGAGTTTSYTPSEMYTTERSSNSSKKCSSGTKCNDGIARKTNWIGEVGLVYPSDYGYTANLSSCKNTGLGSYHTSCYKTSWMVKASHWPITPFGSGGGAYFGFFLGGNGVLTFSNFSAKLNVHPTVYLLPDVKIASGTGDINDKFILSK